jgi:hypothetical protein
MNKFYMLRLTRRLLTLAVLTGCLFMLSESRTVKADELDCLYNQMLCDYGCSTQYSVNSPEWDACADGCQFDYQACDHSHWEFFRIEQ